MKNSLFLSSVLVAGCVLAAAPQAAKAASIDLTVPWPTTTTFDTFVPERRQTHFEVLNNVTLTELGALIDPSVDNQNIRWRVIQSDSAAAFGTELFSQETTLGDLGFQTYDLSLNLALATGFYILELAAIDQFLSMRGLNETNQGVPFVTTDGNFRVLDGGANENFANVLLPAFSVSTTAVPLPAALPLLGTGLAAFGLLGWRRKRRAAI